VVGDAREDVAQISLWVEAVQLGCADQAIQGSGTLTACVGAGKEIILSVMRTFP